MVNDRGGTLAAHEGRGGRQPHGIRIAYVMGYGRSGSTLLDVMLGGHPEITSVGELSYVSEWIGENKHCGCRRPIMECSFWNSVMREYFLAIESESALPRAFEKRVESRRTLLRLLTGRVQERDSAAYRRVQTAMFEALSQVAGNQIIVDSSKSVHRTDGRPLSLQKFTDFDVRTIHLVRDCRAVTWSALRGPGTSDISGRNLPPLVRGAWTVLDWTLTNLICLVLTRWMRPGSVLRVRYEDLVRDPRSELTRIGEFVGVDLNGVSEMISVGEPLSPGHNVGGNRLRFASAVRVKEDREWSNQLPWIYRAFYLLFAWPVAARLGYRLGSG